MANLNRIILIGRLATAPESRVTGDGLSLTKFRLAVNPAQTLSFERSAAAQTEFFDIVAWRRLADTCAKRLKKSSLVLVEGSVQIRSFEDQVGQKRWVTEVVASEVSMLDMSKVQSQDVEPATVGRRQTTLDKGQETVDDSDLSSDLPF